MLLQDMLRRLHDIDTSSIMVVLENLLAFIQDVHNHGLSAELLQCELAHSAIITHSPDWIVAVGACFNSIVRRAADGSMGTFDPSPLFLIISTLVESNKAHSRVRSILLPSFASEIITSLSGSYVTD